MVGGDITSGVLQALNSAQFLDSLNHTNIVLISKKKNSDVVADYRPIFLCNVLYEIVEVLANRLKGILPNIISSTQSAFVLGRLITNNVLIAYEVMHYLNKEKKVKNAHMFLKLDMSKAYDKLK